MHNARNVTDIQIHLHRAQSSIYVIEQISLRIKFVKFLFFSYDNSLVLSAADTIQ